MFAPAFDHSFNDLFNQYVNSDPSTSGDGSKDVHFGSDFDQFFSVGSFSSDCGELSPNGSKHFQQSSPQSWRKDAWTVQQDSLNDLQLHRPKPVHDTVQPSDVVSGFNAVSLEESSPEALGLFSTSPSSPPTTPSRKNHSKSVPITPKNVRVRKTNDRATLHRKQSSSPSLMRSAHLQRSKMAYPENWSSRLQQQFNSQMRADERLPLSPPPSDILVQNESMRRDSGIHLNSSSENLADFSPHYASTMYSSKLQQPASFINQRTSTPPPVDDIFATPSSSDSQQLHAWHADALASTFQLTPDLNGHDGHWWSSPLPTRVSQPQNQNSYLVSSLSQKSPMIHTNQNQQQHHHELLQNGLMIDFGSSFDLGASNDAFSSAAPLHSTTATHIPITSHQQPTFSHHPYIPTTQATHQQFIAKPSRTPSLSPTNTTSPKSHPGMKNITPRRTHARKLSSNSTSAPKPVKLSTPTKGGKGSSNVSFVNFTPSDSKKILTGVAPSGSSKTKARREQEAREKRRKLSEAALLAVRNAGGDVEALEAVLC
ncbi:uncharacterized protein BHQ10_004564 [Talaromyces amestolkiae]|uniref:Developmental regulatory protein wetA n=1 Tax=Talaromyces amestolkiae TaxID=1196081 RepID=A0A364KYC3_TALAM|nr:uncharacterized protein BHQ10_004564 [Talaromyces amestolkiae]RAO68552.1 hypothetical protein BHQ10_004564 [Talaromyces amestolkiae]